MNKKIVGVLVSFVFLVFIATTVSAAQRFDVTDISYSYLSYNYNVYPNVPTYNYNNYYTPYYGGYGGYVNPWTGYITYPTTYVRTYPTYHTTYVRPIYTHYNRTISYSSPSTFVTFSWQ